MSSVANKIAMVARSATKRARDFATTLTGASLAGGLRCCVRCEGGAPFAALRALHPIPQNRERGYVERVQCFQKVSS